MSLGTFPMHVMLRVSDIAKQRRFYLETLGLRDVSLPKSVVAELEAGNGTRITLYPGPPSKADHTVAAFTVTNLEETIKTLEGRGVRFEDLDMPGIKTANHIATQDNVKVAWFKDPEGNWLSLIQRIR